MDATYLHLLLNHFPIVGTLIGSSIMLWGMVKNQRTIKVVGAAIIIAMSLLAIPVYLSGEPAEERVEHLAGISETVIEEHEEAAELAIWMMAAAGIASLLALLLRNFASKLPFGLATALALLAFLAMARVGYYGGQIRHTELNAERRILEAPIE